MSEGESILDKGKANKAKLEKSKFKQQTLSSWRPNQTMVTTLVTFLIFGVIFLSLGILLVELAKNIDEAKVTYHSQCGNLNPWNITIEVKTKMKSPVYVYYEIDNFYQNHRRYVKSRNNEQLKGNVLSVDSLTTCDPITTMKDLGRSKSLDETPLDDDAPAFPCGLIAKSFFNDTYKLTSEGNKPIKINEEGIAWETDRKYLFNNVDNYRSIQWLDVEDEHFIVWMRVAGFPNFKKPWGRIEEDLDPGNYTVTIENIYDVSSFNGRKSLFFSTTDAYGGKNTFLAVLYLVVGGLWFVFAGIFFVAHLRQKKRQKKE